jgi:carboxymethylenebutenolidase
VNAQHSLKKETQSMERKNASEFDQELLNLFDQYVHGGISRRDFMDGAAKFAVGGLTAAAIFEALRPNYAYAEQVPKDDKRLKTEFVTFPSPQGYETVKAYLVRPVEAKGKLPGVLVVHENRGLNPYIRCRAASWRRRIPHPGAGRTFQPWRLSR